jgi:hypothetical protein
MRLDGFDRRSGGRGADQVGELLQHLQMLIAENAGRARKHFENSRNAPCTVDRNDGDGPDAYRLADLGIHPPVVGNVLTA